MCHSLFSFFNTAYHQWSSFVLNIIIIIYGAFFFSAVIGILSLHCTSAIFKMLKTEFGINADIQNFPIHFAAQVAFKFL